jgi:hypothetical protein
MLRITSTALLGLALALPLSAFAESTVDQKTPAVSIVAANEDAVLLPAAPSSQQAERSEVQVPKHNARRGSNQSAAEFRFTNPYAFPLQALPIAIPSITTFSF